MVRRSLLLLLLFPTTAYCQTGGPGGRARIEILNADLWVFEDSVAPGAQRLKGNVRFQHANAIMSCDSAWLMADQSVDAYGDVHIRQGDTLTITSERLHYTAADRTAQLDGNVHLTDPGTELSTEHLIYDLRSRVATYVGGGTIRSRKDNNTLESQRGSYLAGERQFRFSGGVRLTHPERTITSDTLHYDTRTGVAHFFGPTDIVQAGTIIHCNAGSYDTRLERARFRKRATIASRGQVLEGDSLHYDRNTGIGLAWGNVSVLDTVNALAVKGDHGRFNELEDRSMITGHAELVMDMDGDTLFLHGDTLHATRDSSGNGRRIEARHRVRFFKSDLQGVCDTMIHAEADSMIHLLGSPFLWSNADQISGDRIRLQLAQGRMHRLYVDRNAFMASRSDSVHFDQVAGTTMTGFFEENDLRRILAEGNGRTIYFAKESVEGVDRTMGMNKAECSNIEVKVLKNEVNTVTFLGRPDAVLYPIDKVPEGGMQLKGFVWNEEARPKDRASIFP